MKTLVLSTLAMALAGSIVFVLLATPESPKNVLTSEVLFGAFEYLEAAREARNSVEYSEANSHFGQALRLVSPSDQDNLEGVIRLEYSSFMIERGEYDRALSMLNDLGKDSTSSPYSPLQNGWKICTETEALIRSGRYEKAAEGVRDCLHEEIRLHSRSAPLEAYGEHLKGFLYHVQGHYALALDHYQSALSTKRDVYGIESLEYSNTLNNIANVGYSLGTFEKSLVQHKEVLAIREALLPLNHPKIGGSLGNIGNIYTAVGGYSKALEYHFRALAIWSNLFDPKHPQKSFTLNNIGIVYNELGNYEEASKYLTRSLTAKQESLGNEHSHVATTLLHLATSQLNLGRTSAAFSSINEAIHIFKLHNMTHHPKYELALRVLANIQVEFGQSSDAIRILNDSIDQSKYFNYSLTSLLLNDLAEIYLEKKDYRHARSLAQQSIELNTGTNTSQPSFPNPSISTGRDVQELIRALKIKADSYLIEHHFVRTDELLLLSLDAMDRAIELVSSMRRHESSIRRHDDASHLEMSLTERALKTVFSFNDLSGNSRILERGFQWVDQQKSGRLLNAMTDSQAKARALIPDSLLAAEVQIHDEIRNTERRIRSQSNSRGVENATLSSLRHSLFKLRKQLDDLIEFEERAYPKYYALKHGVRHANLEDVQSKLLDERTSLVEYFDAGDSTYAFIITDNDISLATIASMKDLKNVVDSLNTGYKQHMANNILTYSNNLYDIIIGSIIEYINNDNMIVIPNNILSSISFESLTLYPLDTSEGPVAYHKFPYLIHERMISYGFSASLLLQQQEYQQPSFSKDILAFAPVFDGSESYSGEVSQFLRHHMDVDESVDPRLAKLPGSAREVREIAALLKNRNGWWSSWRAKESDVLLRSRSSEHHLKTVDLSSYRYIHFATHGFSDPDDPGSSGIILQTKGDKGEDGILYASELFGLSLNAELVVLSSCDTAKGSNMDVGGLAGFARGFIYAGAQNLVASLWPSDDVATQLLMEQFYNELAQGHATDTALRNAKLHLLRSKGPIAKPHYWSGFIHIGVPSKQPPVRNTAD